MKWINIIFTQFHHHESIVFTGIVLCSIIFPSWNFVRRKCKQQNYPKIINCQLMYHLYSCSLTHLLIRLLLLHSFFLLAIYSDFENMTFNLVKTDRNVHLICHLKLAISQN